MTIQKSNFFCRFMKASFRHLQALSFLSPRILPNSWRRNSWQPDIQYIAANPYKGRSINFLQQKMTVILCTIAFTSCIPSQRLINFQEDTELFASAESIQQYSEVTIQPNDQLFIQVSALDEEAAQPFNIQLGEQSNLGPTAQLLAGYLVDSDGFIEYPRLGKVLLGGLTRAEATNKIKGLITPYLDDPIVKVGILNFKVTVFGEVVNPQTISVANERLTIVEALAQAGLTPYSIREKIWVIREENGKRVFGKVNLYSRNIFNSPYFHLKQNDVIYVEPTRDVVTTLRQPILAVVPWVSSILGLGTTVYLLFFNNN